ncbi:hypothetical protein ADUPG1_010651, partial [Aduncisulcus paluster]
MSQSNEVSPPPAVTVSGTDGTIISDGEYTFSLTTLSASTFSSSSSAQTIYNGVTGYSDEDHKELQAIEFHFEHGNWCAGDGTVSIGSMYQSLTNAPVYIDEPSSTLPYDKVELDILNNLNTNPTFDPTIVELFCYVDFSNFNEFKINVSGTPPHIIFSTKTYSCESNYDFPDADSNVCVPYCFGSLGNTNCNDGTCTAPDICSCNSGYGAQCDHDCPFATLDNGTEDMCSNSSGQGVCDISPQCSCTTQIMGDACEFVEFNDSDLESFICNLTSACNDDGHITPANLASLTTLDISSKLGITSGSITDLGGLRHATGLTRLTAICDGSCSSLTFDLSELETLSSLEYVNVSGTNMSSPSGAKLDFLPSSVRTLILDDVSLPSTTSLLSGLSVTTLSVQNNTSFAPTSTSVFPSSLTSLDISGCTSFAPTSTSVFPSSLTSLDISGCTSITALDVLPTTLTE